MGMQRSVQKSAIRQGWVRPVRQEQAQGILIEALGMLATHFGSERPSERAASPCKSSLSGFVLEEQSAHRPPEEVANEASLTGR